MKGKVIVFGVAVAVASVLAPVMFLSVLMAPAIATSPVTCTITGTVKGLTHDQSGVAEAIAGRAEFVGLGDAGVRVGILTSLALTHLTNLATSSTSRAVGIFAFDPKGQWGPVTALSDTSEASVLFMAALEQTPDWQAEPATRVASTVMTANGVAVPATPAVFKRVLKRARAVAEVVIAMAAKQNACSETGGHITTSTGGVA